MPNEHIVFESEKMETYWGLSYASFLTIPRVFIQDMPIEWQDRLADLLEEYDEVFCNQPDLGTRVQITRKNKLIKTPRFLINYRHPDQEIIDSFKSFEKPKKEF